MMGRMLDWEHDESPFDDWIDEVYLHIEARSRGRLNRETLEPRPVLETMTLCEMMVAADHEVPSAVEHLMRLMVAR